MPDLKVDIILRKENVLINSNFYNFVNFLRNRRANYFGQKYSFNCTLFLHECRSLWVLSRHRDPNKSRCQIFLGRSAINSRHWGESGRGGSNQRSRGNPTTVDIVTVSLKAISFRGTPLGQNVTIYDHQSLVSASERSGPLSVAINLGGNRSIRAKEPR